MRVVLQRAKRASVVVAGPGLDQDEWARAMLSEVLARDGPKVLDADALNLLAGGVVSARLDRNCVLTPHFGSANRRSRRAGPASATEARGYPASEAGEHLPGVGPYI